MSGEIRIPNRLLSLALEAKNVKALRLFAAAKLQGHRSEIKPLCASLKIHPKTCKRLAQKIIDAGWAGSDGVFLFPRSWRKLKLSKRSGLYLTRAPTDLKRFEALAFAMGLKRVYRQQGSPHSKKGRVKQEDFPTGFLCHALGLKERRFKTLKAQAQRYRYISVKPQVRVIGKARDYAAMQKNLHGPPVFIRGKHVVTPDISRIKVLV
jgi:hypothetical protein